MPYKFPKRYPRDNDYLDVEQIKETLQPLVTAVTSEVAEHNVTEEEQSFAESSFYQCVLEATTVPLGYGGSVPHTQPPEVIADLPANSVTLDNSGGWIVVDSISEFATSDHEALQLWFQANYVWTGFDNSGNHNYADHDTWHAASGLQDQPWRVPSVRFGVRINGQVVAFTGTQNPNYRPHIPLTAEKEIQEFDGSASSVPTNNADWPGPLLWKSRRCSGPSKTMMAVRLSDIFTAVPGRVKVELVARRLKRFGKSAYAANDVVAVTTRQLFMVRFPVQVSRQRDPDALAMTNVQVGDDLNQANLFTNNMEVLETAANNLTSQNLNKLNRYHYPMPLVVSDAGVVQVGFVGHTFSPVMTCNNWCPGETASTFAAVGTLIGTTGWTPLYDGSSEVLVTPSSGSIVAGQKRGYLLVTGRVVLQSIKRNGAGFNDYTQTHNQQAAVAIYQKVNSTRTLRPESVVPVGRTATPAPSVAATYISTGTIEDNVEVPVTAVLDFSEAAAADDIDGFGICVSSLNYVGSTRVDVKVVEANLSFEYFLP